MNAIGLAQIAIVLAAVLAAAVPLGAYVARVLSGQRNFLSPLLAPVERLFYKIIGRRSDARAELVLTPSPCSSSPWPASSRSTRCNDFSIAAARSAGFRSGPAGSRLQHVDQLRHQHELAELWRRDDDSHLTQMSASPCIISSPPPRASPWLSRWRAASRARNRRRSAISGPISRAHLYVLLPISIVVALVFVALGVPQTLAGSLEATTSRAPSRSSRSGPVASQEAIKELGTNGGGFFNANSAHPYENPNAITNILEIWALLVIPFASLSPSAAWSATSPGPRDLSSRWQILLVAGVAVAYWGGGRRQSAADRARRRSVARQHGRQGGTLRRR